MIKGDAVRVKVPGRVKVPRPVVKTASTAGGAGLVPGRGSLPHRVAKIILK